MFLFTHLQALMCVSAFHSLSAKFFIPLCRGKGRGARKNGRRRRFFCRYEVLVSAFFFVVQNKAAIPAQKQDRGLHQAHNAFVTQSKVKL